MCLLLTTTRKELRYSLPIALAICLSSTWSAGAQLAPTAADVAGKYTFCLIACETIELHADRRFTYTLEGDLFGYQQARGYWRIDQSFHVFLNTDEQPSVFETIVDRSDGVSLKVVDRSSTKAPFLTLSLSCPEDFGTWEVLESDIVPAIEDAHELRRTADGYLYLADCEAPRFRIELLGGPTFRYTPLNKMSNEFVFYLDSATSFYFRDDEYYWEPGSLRRVSDDGELAVDPLRLR